MVKAQIKYTLDDFKAFSRLIYYRKSNRARGAHGIIAAAMNLLVIIFFIISVAFTDMKFSDVSFYCIIMFIGFAMFVYFKIFTMIVIPKNNLKKVKKIYGENSVLFTFEEKYFNVSVENGLSNEDVSMEYSKLHSVTETDKYFFFSIVKNNAYVVPKSSFIEGDSNRLREIITGNTGVKFIQKNC